MIWRGSWDEDLNKGGGSWLSIGGSEKRVGNIMGIIEMESNIKLYYKWGINIGFRIFIDGEWKNEWNIKVER